MQRLEQFGGRISRLLPTRLYLHLHYYRIKRERLNLKNPVRFAHKIQWLKVHGHLERYTEYADKYSVRAFVEKRVGAEHLIPLLGVWDDFDEIHFDELPDQFVLKVTHGCGYNYICKDKSQLDYAALRRQITSWQKEDFYRRERETQYKNCSRRIIGEAYMEDESGGLTDFKFFCSQGVPQAIQYEIHRFTDRRTELLDTKFDRLGYVAAADRQQSEFPPPKPANLDDMLSIAAELSRGFPFVRVDLYSIGGRVYFGELTFTPGSGLVGLEPDAGELKFGEMVDLNAYQDFFTPDAAIVEVAPQAARATEPR